MLDSEKSQEQLLRELEELRQRVAVSEQAEAESRRMEKSLQQEHNLLRTLIDLLPDCIYVKDTHGRFLVANRAVARIMNAASPYDLLGKTDQDFYPGWLAVEFGRDERQVIESGEPLVNKDEPGINPDGSPRRSSRPRCRSAMRKARSSDSWGSAMISPSARAPKKSSAARMTSSIFASASGPPSWPPPTKVSKRSTASSAP